MRHTLKTKLFTATFTDERGYFSLTGNYGGGSGAVGNRIAQIDPRFKLLNELHLANCETGEPMHAEANASYFAQQADAIALANHLRVSEEKAYQIIGYAQYNAKQHTERTKKQRIELQKIRTIKSPDVKQHALRNFIRQNNIKSATGKAYSVTDYNHDLVINKVFDQLKTKPEENQLQKAYIKTVCDDLRPTWQEQAKQAYALIAQLAEEMKSEFSEVELNVEDEIKSKIHALAKLENIPMEDIDYKDEVDIFQVNGCEYYVLSDAEADEKVRDEIERSVWAFNPSFLADYTGLPEKVFTALQTDCESANETIIELIELKGGIEEFMARAIAADGRGHFLSQYDGKEAESDGFFIYKI